MVAELGFGNSRKLIVPDWRSAILNRIQVPTAMTGQNLRTQMRQIPLTHGKFALVDDCDFEWLMQWKWHVHCSHGTCYAVRTPYRPIDRRHDTVRMHRAILNAPKHLLVDHINHNGLDNRRENLRFCTNAQNIQNRRGPQSNSTTGYRGVHWNKFAQKFSAQIAVNGVKIHLGYFNTGVDAARAYEEAARLHYGIFYEPAKEMKGGVDNISKP